MNSSSFPFSSPSQSNKHRPADEKEGMGSDERRDNAGLNCSSRPSVLSIRQRQTCKIDEVELGTEEL